MDSEIWLDGRAYLLRPSFENLSNIEQELDTGIVALARRLITGDVTLEETAVIIRHCLAQNDHRPDIKQALCRGLAGILETIATMFATVLSEEAIDYGMPTLPASALT